MRAALLAVGIAACVHTPVVVYRPDVLDIVQTDSDKAVQIVSDERIADHEPRAVEAPAVAQALIGSGQFLDDDARNLAPAIARRLATMHPEESIRIVAWAADAPRYYYLVIHGGKLHVSSYLGETRTDDYAAVIPTPAEPIVAPPPIAPPAPVATPIDAGVPAPDASPPPPPVAPAPTPAPRPTAPVHRLHPAPRPGTEPISEAEARRRIAELDAAEKAGLITPTEHRAKRKDVLARL